MHRIITAALAIAVVMAGSSTSSLAIGDVSDKSRKSIQDVTEKSKRGITDNEKRKQNVRKSQGRPADKK